jgi:putative peptide zinc metalloprotease protein
LTAQAGETTAEDKKEAKPRFRPDIIRHSFDEKGGGRSVVLEDPVANKFFRISQYEYDLLSILDGRLSIREAIERLKLHGRYYTEDYASMLVEQSARAGLLLGTLYGSAQYQSRMKQMMDNARRKRSLFKLYFLYIPVLNPDRFLEKTLWFWRLLVNRLTAILLLVMAPGAVYLLVTGSSRLESEFLFFFNLRNLFVLWIAIAVVKLVHEFSHAYTAKGFGLRVPEMGIAMLLFFPCLYCNTTAAWQLADRKQRMSIALAGVFSEAVVAVISVYIWYFSAPGLLNSVAFFLMAISLISSLFFNGNPLLKFDGYFALIDYLRMPNLQGKAFAHLRYLFLNGVLGIREVRQTNAPRNERPILLTYGVSALIYRVFLYSGIIIGVYLRFDKTVGALLGVLAFALFVVRPVAAGTASLIKRRSDMHFRPYGLAVFLIIVACFVYILTIPWAGNSVYPCYLASARIRQIVIPAEAPVKQVLAREGDRVDKGRTIFRLDPTRLNYELKEKELKLAMIEREIAIIENTAKELSKLPLKNIERAQAKDAVEEITKDMKDLEWKAPFSGALSLLAPDLQPGAYPEKGTVVGELSNEENCEVIGLVPGVDIARVPKDQKVEVWFPIGEGRSFELQVSEISPFNREDLQGSPFSSRFGGEIATEVKDRMRKDSPLEAYYLCKMDFSNQHGLPLGLTGRLVVRTPPRTTLERLYDGAYRVFRRETIF